MRHRQASREPEIDAAVFVDFMLGVTNEALAEYATATLRHAHVGVNVGVSEAVLSLLRAEPTLSAAALATRLGKTSRTIERHIAELKSAGRLQREGSAKAGRWVVR